MNSLIEERNLACREVEPGGSPVETFLKVWPRLEPHYGTMAEQLKSALEGALTVRCTVSARVKSLNSITKSIERRQVHRGEQYKDVDQIFDELHDLAGFRIVVDYPSGIQITNAFIKQSFEVKSTNVFKADREFPHAWKPTFGSFRSENHHVVLHPDAKYPLSPFCGILFEIQTFSLAESLYNRLAHPLLYKKSSGHLSMQEQKMIDVTHGLSLCYWICLSSMEDRLEGKQTEEIPIPIQTVAQLDGSESADMEALVKATPYPMVAYGARIPIEKCLDTVKDLSKQSMSSDQLHDRISTLLNCSTQVSTTNANYGSGHIVQNYGSGSNTHSNNTYNSGGGNISFAKDDTEDEIRNAFWVTDPQSHKDDIEERKGGLIPESYRWILQDEYFTKWRDQEYSLLWLNGDPGKGKTMSVCGIIDYINVRASEDSSILLSYFFCDASDSSLNNATSVLRGILYSVIFQNSTALSYVRERFKELSKPLSNPRLAWPVLQKLFIGILGAIKGLKIYLVIDALDECREGRDKLLEFIVKQSSLLAVKWLVSSRKWPVIREVLTTYPLLLDLALENNEQDVSAAVGLYISHQVEDLSKIKQYDTKRKKAVEDRLRSKSNNTFLWVSLVCQMLKQIPAWQTIKRLEGYPAGLDALYGRMLEQIQPSSREKGHLGLDGLYVQIISFTLGAFRPLSLDELYHLIDDEEIAIRELEDIVALCGSFLTIQNRVVYFIHDSAKGYLLNESSGFKFNRNQQHTILFSQSLSNLTRLLHRDILHLESSNPRTVQEGLGSISYQSLHWVSHLIESAPSTLTQELIDGSLVDNFLRQKFLFWLEALGHLKSISLGISEMLKLDGILQNHDSQLKDKLAFPLWLSWLKRLAVIHRQSGDRNSSQLKNFVHDGLRFIRYHKSGIEQTPLQVYLLLNFTPYKSATRMVYESQAPEWFTLQQGLHDCWGPYILMFEGHTADVLSVAFSHDGRLLASGSRDRTVKIWDVSSGVCLHTLVHDKCVYVLAFSTKNYNVATSSKDRNIKIWDANNGVLIRTLLCDNSLCWQALTFSKNGNLIASSTHDRKIRLFDTTSGECKRELMSNDVKSEVWSIAFTHDDQILSCGTDDSLLIWDLEDQTEPHRIKMDCLSFSSSSLVSSRTNELFFIRGHEVEVWNPATKRRIRTIRFPIHHIQSRGASVILSRHGTLLGVIVDNDIMIFDASTLEWNVQIRGAMCTSSVSPTSGILAVVSNRTIEILDISSISHRGHSSPAMHISPVFSKDGSLVVTDSDTATELIVWRSCTGEAITVSKKLHEHFRPAIPFYDQFIFSSDGQMLILRYKQQIHITHIFKGDVGFIVSLPESHNGELAISHDNRWLTVSFPTHVSIFELGTPSAEIKIGLNKSIDSASCSFSHDNKTLAVHHGAYINLYETNTWRCNSILCNAVQEGIRFRTVLFSSDDKFLATISHNIARWETELNIWNLETRVCTRMLPTQGCFVPLRLEVSKFLQLETDLGTFQIIDGSIQPLLPRKYAISKNLEWILRGSERLIWLPLDCRPRGRGARDAKFRFCRTCSKFKVAITTVNRRLVILTLP